MRDITRMFEMTEQLHQSTRSSVHRGRRRSDGLEGELGKSVGRPKLAISIDDAHECGVHSGSQVCARHERGGRGSGAQHGAARV